MTLIDTFLDELDAELAEFETDNAFSLLFAASYNAASGVDLRNGCGDPTGDGWGCGMGTALGADLGFGDGELFNVTTNLGSGGYLPDPPHTNRAGVTA